jgi:hypothetical protein
MSAPKKTPADFADEAAARIKASNEGRVTDSFVMDVSQHPRIANPNPLVKQVEAGANPKTVIPDDTIIVRGGQNYAPQEGNVISAQMGANATDAAAGLPHGTVRPVTAGEIRAAGGTVELVPEPVYPGGPVNTWHVNVTEGAKPAFPAEGVPNPAPKADRLIPPKE